MTEACPRAFKLRAVLDRLGKAHSGLALNAPPPCGELRVGSRVDRLMELRPARDADQRGIRQSEVIAREIRRIADHGLQLVMALLDRLAAMIAQPQSTALTDAPAESSSGSAGAAAIPLHRRHLVEGRQGGIEAVPGMTAQMIGHRLRLVAGRIVEAGGVDGEEIRHGGKGEIDR